MLQGSVYKNRLLPLAPSDNNRLSSDLPQSAKQLTQAEQPRGTGVLRRPWWEEGIHRGGATRDCVPTVQCVESLHSLPKPLFPIRSLGVPGNLPARPQALAGSWYQADP